MKLTRAALLVLTVAIGVSALAQQHGTIFIVRHAEKQAAAPNGGPAPADPELTDVGRKRAACLAQTLKDSGIATVITSGVTRTNQTAQPLADTLRLQLTKLPSIPETIATARNHATKGNVVIVGHGNTIPEIVKRLTQTQVSVPDEAFDLMFVVTPGPHTSAVTIHYCPAEK